ncbi:c-type cytochrome [Shimia sediminis]|uniref:c-type cytochrome n=1 Tax=Shimia sediminis TaxID=2497945 RepID=UPI000F8EE43D|nr:c-type cytochrome [Shimia sediminis]
MTLQLISMFRKASAAVAVGLMATTSVQAAGSDTFKSVCSECHTGGFKGFMSGAPNVEKPATWQKYLARDSKAQMQETVLRGTKDHKAKGGCASCSDQQIIDAIDYMLKRVQ